MHIATLHDWRYLPTVMPIISWLGAVATGIGIVLGDGVEATPTTILGAFIAISLGAIALIGWIVREQFKQAAHMTERLEAKDARIDRTIALLEQAQETNRQLTVSLQELIHKIPSP